MTQGPAEGVRRSRLESGPEAFSDPLARAAPVTREGFCAGFDRCFGRVYAYVSRRVSDRESCERIVSEVLAANLDLLVNRGDERQELIQLKAASDRLIGSKSAVDTTDGKVTLHGTVSSADEKARAERTAEGVEGVHEVRNLLQVVEKPRRIGGG